jgi:hypothetical protein
MKKKTTKDTNDKSNIQGLSGELFISKAILF